MKTNRIEKDECSCSTTQIASSGNSLTQFLNGFPFIYWFIDFRILPIEKVECSCSTTQIASSGTSSSSVIDRVHISGLIFGNMIACKKFLMRVPCVIFYGLIQMIAVVGVSLLDDRHGVPSTEQAPHA
ncbi:hypothetical protein PIB30_017607 [Stylosanthes scabra]|uniref:Uncharacterized protein n=1 Tax=Stylosanthes scabra TaxID=79078 RepID=A0ABU6V6M3_9FABA|nr:hypothetical protein [Stylosanthes scabra]